VDIIKFALSYVKAAI